MSKRWVHVTTDLHSFGTPNVPVMRNNGKYDYVHDDELYDPNTSGSFGDDQPTKWLEGIVEDKPVFDTVTEQLEKNSSTDIEGADVIGAYDLGTDTWRVIYSIIANEVDPARQQKLGQLEADLYDAQTQGYTAAGKILTTYNEDVNFHASQLSWLKHLVEKGKRVVGDDTAIKDSNGNILVIPISSYYTQMGNYMDLAETLKVEKFVAEDALADAITVAEVDAVTWDFQTIVDTLG